MSNFFFSNNPVSKKNKKQKVLSPTRQRDKMGRELFFCSQTKEVFVEVMPGVIKRVKKNKKKT